MEFKDGAHFDVVIIGAGMSGLAAGIRLRLFGKTVLVLERHNVIGGLNSFYSIDGRKYDVGLHALTNYIAPGKGRRSAALNFLLRQLRLSREDFALAEQMGSRIAFPGLNLHFNNDIALLQSEIALHFPDQIDGFIQLCKLVSEQFGKVPQEQSRIPSRTILQQYIKDLQLENLLLLPIMAYGSSQEHDMDWEQFVNLFQSVFLEGFARPFEGVRQILHTLRKKLSELEGIRKMKCGVQRIECENGKLKALLLDNGFRITADKVLSSAGYLETLALCGQDLAFHAPTHTGNISFVETMRVYKKQPREFGWKDTIVFFCEGPEFDFSRPKDPVGLNCGVICFPNNYRYANDAQLPEGFFRISALANFDAWSAFKPAEYQEQKAHWATVLHKQALLFLPKVDSAHLDSQQVADDMFTPTTIRRYTGHYKGAVYGSPQKMRSGQTPIENVFICGTDQGMLGITGAMISGIAMANTYALP